MILEESLFEDVLEELQYNNKRDEDEAEEETFDDSYLFDEEEEDEDEEEIEEQLKKETDPEKRREIVSEISDLADEAEKCEDSNNPYGASDAREEIKKLEESDSSSKMFVELDEFRKSWKDLGLTDEDLRKLQNEIITNGDISIPLGSDVYKIQFSPDSLNKGKSTAFRVIYTIIKKDQIYLVYAFNKSNEANITKNTLSAIRKTANVLNDKEN